MKTYVTLLTTLVTLTLLDLALARKGQRKDCQYSKGDWGECDASNEMTRTLTLKDGDPLVCKATKTVTRSCNKNGRCRYERAPWGDCNAETQKKSRTVRLKSGDPTECEATKTETRPCKNDCKYKRLSASACENGQKNITKTLKRGDPSVCSPTKIETKKCKTKDQTKDKSNRRKKGRRRKNKMYSCQYSVAERSECDDVSNTTTLTLTLKRGLTSLCDATKTLTRPCEDDQVDENGCVYGSPVVSECENNERSITKTLKSGDEKKCPKTKTKTKKCTGGRGKKGRGKKGKKNRRRPNKQE